MPDDATDAVYAALTVRHADFTPEEIADSLGAEPPFVQAALQGLVAAKRAVALPHGAFVSDKTAQRLSTTARRTVTTFHQQNPLRRAMPRRALREPLAKAANVRDFRSLMQWLAAEGVLEEDEGFGARLPGHVVVLPNGWQAPAEEMLAVYRSAGLTPPDPANFQANYPRDVRVLAILDVLAERGDLVKLAEGLYLSAETVESVKAVVRRLAATPAGITVGTVRDALNSSRKLVVPLLERLDAEGLTRRVGEIRVLAEPQTNRPDDCVTIG